MEPIADLIAVCGPPPTTAEQRYQEASAAIHSHGDMA